MNTAIRHHWDAVYRTRADTQTSWHRAHLDTSLRLLDALGLDAGAPVIDVGGGRSTFVDDLLARGLREVSVLDVAGEALAQARARLGASAAQVHWIADDATTVDEHGCRGRRRLVDGVDGTGGDDPGAGLARPVEGGELPHDRRVSCVSVRAVNDAVTGASSECCGARRVQMPASTAIPVNIAMTDQMLPVHAISWVANHGEKPAQIAAPTPMTGRT